MQRGHGSILIAKSVLRPHRALAPRAVDGIYESITAGFASCGTFDCGIREETWWHAGPNGEDYEGYQVACSHCSSSRLKKPWSHQDGAVGCWWEGWCRHWDGSSVFIEPDEEKDCPRDMDEGINPIHPCQSVRMLEKEMLDWKLPENVERLFELD
jgi:hypothetical protein